MENFLPTCTQITDALEVLASAVPNPNVLVDLTGLVAPLEATNSPVVTFADPLQLSVGGQALLLPDASVLDGKLFQIIISGTVKPTVSLGFNEPTMAVCLGSSTSTILTSVFLDTSGSTASFPITLFLTARWDSVSESLLVWGSSTAASGAAIKTTGLTSSDMQFSVYAGTVLSGGESDPGNVITLSQIKLQLI